MAKKSEEKEMEAHREIKDIQDLIDFKIDRLEDFEIYNKAARRLGKPIKVPDESYHKKVKVKFQRFDQPTNLLKARVRNKEIDWSGQLKPGFTYDLPMAVVKWLNGLSVPIYKEVKTTDGGETITETKCVGENSRFSCQVIDF
jgi:hypothetical protein